MNITPGTIVRCRNRDWVLLPSEGEEFLLRPLSGDIEEAVRIHKKLSDLVGYTLSEERVRPSTFPLPTEKDLSDAASAHLLWQAARLNLREGASPLRSIGKISLRPRVYQFVPLLMALRLDPIRLFIADDVGVGKTIEALLIASELLDRNEIRQICVLCPPYLCDQWYNELQEKFNLEAVVIRSGTVSSLERRLPPGKTIYEFFPIQVISIDWVKGEHNRHQFLQFCPELVIVDEVHGAAETAKQTGSQQERHRLLRDIAGNTQRHLILLTATPHSGIEEAFRSLLSLLNPHFQDWNLSELDEPKRIELARHFVQRTRKDIEKGWESEKCFPERESIDDNYELSPQYRNLFDRTYAFCSEIVKTGQGLEKQKQRVRYWGALALLRCVMSSPAAAKAALESRTRGILEAEETGEFGPFIFESSEDRTDDQNPTSPVEATEKTLTHPDIRKLRELARLAQEISHADQDTKLTRCIQMVKTLIQDGFNPIIWCRYVATAEYVGQHLNDLLSSPVQVVTITGQLGDEERRLKIEEIDTDKPRVLVATDCLSEGVNLQDKFTAVVHYDLPWNPNRLEQREGRVDRYGQKAPRVKAIRFYGRDNPVDGVVIEVLLNKAREIHQKLGTHVPVPEESESVTQALLNALFLRHGTTDKGQLRLFEDPSVTTFHHHWERDAERERMNRTRFAQRAIKPEEVQRELEAADQVLGDPQAVRDFVLTAAQRLYIPINPDSKRQDVYRINLTQDVLSSLPDAIRSALPSRLTQPTRHSSSFWLISFLSPTPEGAEYIGRNHRFISALARFLLEEALAKPGKAIAARCGVLRTRTVTKLTRILLLRVRYLIEQPQKSPLLSEEVLVLGYRLTPDGKPYWLEDSNALQLLAEAQPDANVPMPEKKELLHNALEEIGEWGRSNEIQSGIMEKIYHRATALEQSHKRIRQAVSLRVRELALKPQFPPDLLGILILQPMVSL